MAQRQISRGSRVLWTKRDLGIGRVLDHNGIEWERTRRGLIGLAKIRTPRPDGTELYSVVWVAESGDTGRVDGPDADLIAMADAYRANVRAQNGRN